MILNNFEWYRRIRGGTWFYVYHKGTGAEYWIRNESVGGDYIIEQTENY